MDGYDTISNSAFSSDGSRLYFSFFSYADMLERTRVYHTDVLPSPGAPVQVSDEAHDVEQLYVLPIGGR